MSLFSGRLATLRASHVMTPDVVTVPAAATIDEAISQLKSHHITGAPVVDGDGRFVGILSLSDLVDFRYPPEDPAVEDPSADQAASASIHGTDPTAWRLFDLAGQLPSRAESTQQTVAERMSCNVVTVAEDASLVDVARIMCEGHWHRVPVIDGNGALCGIIATMDVLAALVNAADEPD